MVLGMFTGKKLSDYIGPGKCDYVAARRIINGTDRAKLVAHYARAYAWHKSAYPDKAAMEADRLVFARPNNPYFWELRGQILLESGKPREALESLGPIFVKFGQVLSTRRDLLPSDVADELARLESTDVGKPLAQALRESPQPQGSEVVVRIGSCGVCHSDVHLHDHYKRCTSGGQKTIHGERRLR